MEPVTIIEFFKFILQEGIGEQATELRVKIVLGLYFILHEEKGAFGADTIGAANDIFPTSLKEAIQRLKGF